MDETRTDDERAQFKAKAIKSLRTIYDDLKRSHDIHRYKEKGEAMMTLPLHGEWYVEALRELQRAGEDIKDWEIREPHKTKYRPVKSAPLEDWINGTSLMHDIRRVLERVDPQPDK